MQKNRGGWGELRLEGSQVDVNKEFLGEGRGSGGRVDLNVVVLL